MTSEIIGLIENQDAYKMWADYGKRGMDESYGLLDESRMSEREAFGILKGSSSEDQITIVKRVLKQGGGWNGELEEAAAIGLNIPEVVDILAQSHETQQSRAEVARGEWFGNRGRQFLNLIETAAIRLREEGLLTVNELDYVMQTAKSSEGTPTIQVTPTTFLERERQSLEYDGVGADFRMAGFVDYRLGIQYLPIRLAAQEQNGDTLSMVHESVHGNMQALEILEMTRSDGWRLPFPRIHGIRITEPNLDEADDKMDFSSVENMEINEGWTEFTARAIMRVIPEFGKAPIYPDDDIYSRWANDIGTLHKNYPTVYKAITRAIFTTATRQRPFAKIEAISDMHAQADKALGSAGSLRKHFLESGKAITGVF